MITIVILLFLIEYGFMSDRSLLYGTDTRKYLFILTTYVFDTIYNLQITKICFWPFYPPPTETRVPDPPQTPSAGVFPSGTPPQTPPDPLQDPGPLQDPPDPPKTPQTPWETTFPTSTL